LDSKEICQIKDEMALAGGVAGCASAAAACGWLWSTQTPPAPTISLSAAAVAAGLRGLASALPAFRYAAAVDAL